MNEFFADNALYVVMIVVLVIWIGIAWYMVRLDKRVRDVEKLGGR